MKYKDELIRSMEWLGKKNDTIFIGQAMSYSGHTISSTLEKVSMEKRYELPVIEDLQMGMSTGLALEGFVPINCYPRFDFFILSLNQLVNHLDKMRVMSKNEMKPRVIIRVAIGAKEPLNGGVQHTQNYTNSIKDMLTEIDVVVLKKPEQIFDAFKNAYEREDSKSTILVEHSKYYAK